MSVFKEKVEALVEKEKLLHPGMKLVVGLSGGADSVALLSVLKELSTSYSLKLYAAHLNHLIREEAATDAAFAQRLAHSLGLPFLLGYARVPHFAQKEKIGLEDAARRARYGFLNHVARKVGAQRIAVGHHLGDQVETVLFNLLRGSGAEGITGIPVQNRGIIRPLLGVTREEIERYCTSCGLDWCVDQTNFSTDFQRNRLRVELLPYLREHFNPRVDKAIIQLADITKEENEFLEELTTGLTGDLLEDGVEGEAKVSLDKFLSFPLALQRRLLRKIIRDSGVGCKDISYKNYNDCLSFLDKSRTGGEFQLPRGWRVVKGSGYFSVFGPDSASDSAIDICRKLVVPGESHIPELGLFISAEIRPYSDFLENSFKFVSKNYQVCFDYDRISLPMFVRTRCAGDRLRPFGLEGTKKLKDLFIDLKIPSHQRDRIPLVVSNDEIHWVVGYRRGAAAPVTEETKQVLLLQAF